MTQLNKEYGIRKVKIGKKVFYSVEDVERLFKKTNLINLFPNEPIKI